MLENMDKERTIWQMNMKKMRSEQNMGVWKEKVEDKSATTVVLATALLRVQVGASISGEVRAMCDTGAQIGCITKECVKKLKLKTLRCRQEVCGFGGPAPTLTSKVRIFLKPWFKSDFSLAVDLFVIDSLNGNYPSSELTISKRKLPNVTLADREFYRPAGIDVLLGAEVWAKVTMQNMYHNGSALLQETRFGFIFLGCAEAVSAQAMQMVLQVSENESEKEPKLEELMRKFWEIEEIASIERARSAEEEAVERIFMEKHYRKDDGRYVVHIPIKPECLPLGNSRAIAQRRFFQLEKRLQRDVDLKAKYVEYMRNCIKMGYMRECLEQPSGNAYYIPHHCVNKKFRVVNDASCKTSNGKSVNDIQMTGEKLQYDLPDQIMRFRRHKIAVIADIEKMFWQVEIDPSQWDLQRVLWREAPDKKLKEYVLTVVTFGMASSVHCAARSMIQSARDNRDEYPTGARIIESDFYIDDLLTGSEGKYETMTVCHEINYVLRSGGFKLRNWISNCKEVEEEFRKEENEKSAIDLSEVDETKVLGLRWLTKTDEFTIAVKTNVLSQHPTKREVLGEIARLYDPNGFLAPVIMVAKLMMQEL